MSQSIQNQSHGETLILLTNDDGFFAEGISVLQKHFCKMGKVYIVAPDRERSATSMALTLHHPLRVKSIEERVYAVSGTPADCVYMAVQQLLPRKPDLLISGINPGPNLGNQDVAYSGTVAGALQGGFLGIPSLAVSIVPDAQGICLFDFAADFTLSIASRWLEKLEGSKVPYPILNINVPVPPIKGIKITNLGEKRYNPEIIVKKDPRDRTYYWVGTGTPRGIGNSESDVMAVKNGYISISPVKRDMTDHDSIKELKLKNIFENMDVGI